MKVFIFGAGASMASQEGQVVRVKAPLVNQLFDVGFDPNYSLCASEIGLDPADLEAYHTAFQDVGSLETWLTDLWDQYQAKRGEFARRSLGAVFGRITFYVWRLMQNVSDTYSRRNGYRLLLDKLVEEDGEYGFISFNYDTLLDRALVDAGRNLSDSLDNYARANYIKPHGSVNWFLRKRTTDVEVSPDDHAAMYRYAAGEMYNGGPIPMDVVVFEPGHERLSGTRVLSGQRFNFTFAYPFVLVPLTTKLYARFDAFEQVMIEPAKDMIAAATDIYLVGYRAADEIIRSILSTARDGTSLHVVGTGGAKGVQESVLAWAPDLAAGEIHTDGFMQFIDRYPS